MPFASCFTLPDHAVLARLDVLARDEHQRTAESLELLGILDSRRLYAAAGYPSLRAYCCERLGYSEDVAEQRIRAARLAARFPRVLACVAEARLGLSTLLLLARHLTPANAEELLTAAAGRTRLEVQTLLAARFPRADLPTVMFAASGGAPTRRAIAVPAGDALARLRGDLTTLQPVPERVEIPRELTSSVVAAPDFELTAPPSQGDAAPERVTARGRIEPLSADRVGVQFTMPAHVLGKLRFARALLGHAVPGGELAQVFERALDALIATIERQRFGLGARSRGGSGDAASIPAEIRAEVYERDGGACTFVSEAGHRCGSDTRLEYDHVELRARGGDHAAANLRLRCKAHNQWEAERVLGAGFMQAKRDEARSVARRSSSGGRSTAPACGEAGDAAGTASLEGRGPTHRDVTAQLPDPTTDLANALRNLGARGDQIRLALERTAMLADAPIEVRMRAALRTLRPAGVKTLRPEGAACGG